MAQRIDDDGKGVRVESLDVGDLVYLVSPLRTASPTLCRVRDIVDGGWDLTTKLAVLEIIEDNETTTWRKHQSIRARPSDMWLPPDLDIRNQARKHRER